VIRSPNPASSEPSAGDATDCALTGLISLDTLQRLQDRFAALAQTSVCMCTIDGRILTRPAWGSRFSEMIGTSRRGRELLSSTVRRLVQNPRPAVLNALHGMSFYAAPICIEDQELGFIVVATRPPQWPPMEQIRAAAEDCALSVEDLVAATKQVKAYLGGTPEDAYQFADVLADTIATLYAQSEHIQRQLADLQTVHGLTELLSGSQELQRILDLTVRRVVEVMPVKACGIRLLDERTGELVVKAVCNLSEEYLKKGPVILAESPIDSAAFAGKAEYIEDARTDPRIRYPQNARREGIVSGLCVPMTYRGQTIGVMRVYSDHVYRFSASEEALLRSIGSQAASAIINARFHEERLTAERTQRQIEAAAQVQRRMLPASLPRHPALQFGAVYQPTLQVGGDFYDFIELPWGEIGVAIADVVGKGYPAALMMAAVRSSLRAHARGSADVGEVVRRVNEDLCRDTLTGEFATLVYGVFSTDGRIFTYCNAGHTAPIFFHPAGVTELAVGGTVLGLQPGTTFEAQAISLSTSDVLVLTTDGINEAIGFSGAAFGRERLLSSIEKHRTLHASAIANHLLWDVRRFVGLADQSDDITVVVANAI